MHWLLESAYIGPFALKVLELLPIAINILALGVLYAVMPNRRPSLPAVAVGATFAGVAWHMVQLAYIQFQIGMANYNAIYGALSQLPITLVWLYVRWAVVLLGAEIAAVFEFGWDRLDAAARAPDQRSLCLHLLVRAAESFRDDGKGVDPVLAARELHVPIEAVNEAVAELQRHRWLAPVEGGHTLVLGRDPAHVRLGDLPLPRADAHVPRRTDPRALTAMERIGAEHQRAWAALTLADVIDQKQDAT